jgi:hypothetical protein
MTMLITRQQGAACRRAAERIAEGDLRAEKLWHVVDIRALMAVGLGASRGAWFTHPSGSKKRQSQVILALLWCAEIAGSE